MARSIWPAGSKCFGSLTVCPSHRLCAGHRACFGQTRISVGKAQQEADLRGPGLAAGGRERLPLPPRPPELQELPSASCRPRGQAHQQAHADLLD